MFYGHRVEFDNRRIPFCVWNGAACNLQKICDANRQPKASAIVHVQVPDIPDAAACGIDWREIGYEVEIL